MRRFVFAVALGLLAGLQGFAEDIVWKAKWLSKQENQSVTNSWIGFRKQVTLEDVPSSVTARIAVDSKYWLWINGEAVVREGGLKRGPSFGDGYYDKVEIAPYLKEGENVIAVLVNYFGKSGFSHQNSGVCAMLFQAEGDGVEILSDKTWQASTIHSFSTAPGPVPNHRLSESNVLYDARKYPGDWYKGESPKFMGRALELGFSPGSAPLGKLVERPIPMWKDYGISEYQEVRRSGDTLICRLPYNCHVTPYLKVNAPGGRRIEIFTDHREVGGTQCISAEYVTKDGLQEFECFEWINGEEVMYVVPADVEVLEVKYRETGYDTELAGSFTCDDDFLNRYWTMAQRTLYVCMRDTYYDCPDRERAQWWGDEVNELGEAFYCLDRKSDALARKGIFELLNWQKEDGTLYAPVPTSNYYNELPMQIMNSVGWYGFHNYYLYSGDSSFVAYAYPKVHKYLHEVWKLDSEGLPIYRTGDWDWPDAGKNQDKYAANHLWYYLALKAEVVFAKILGLEDDAAEDEAIMKGIADRMNETYWTGSAYVTPGFEGAPDDRVQALAVISGIASEDKYPAIKAVLETTYNSTTYMFPYVLEALYQMKEPQMAIDRMKKMYSTIMKDGCSTLYEHWNFEGSCNHAWAGGGVISMGNRLAGIEPVAPGFRVFRVAPQMGDLKSIQTKVVTNYGPIEVSLQKKGSRINATIIVPEGTRAQVTLSNGKEASLAPGTHNVKL